MKKSVRYTKKKFKTEKMRKQMQVLEVMPGFMASENTIANSMKPMCSTKAFYKGKEIDLNDLTIVWSDHWGNPKSGDINDFASSRSDDAVSENEAGEGW